VNIESDIDRPKRIEVSVWRKILRFAAPYRRQAFLLAVMALIIALCEVTFPYLTGRVIDHVEQQLPFSGVAPLLAVYAVVAVIISAAICGFILCAGRIATGVNHDIRQASFAKLQSLSFSYFDHRPVGWILSRLTSDCERLSRIIGWTLLDFVWGFSLLTGIAVVMLWLNWSLALIVLTVAPPLALVSLYFQRLLLGSARDIRRSNAEITAMFNENISGVRTSKAFVRESENLVEFQAASGRMYEHTVRNALQSALFVPFVIALGSLMAALALWFGGGRVLAGGMSLGSLVAFLNYAGLFFQPVQELARHWMEVQMAQAAAERIQSLLETEPAICDDDAVQREIESRKKRGAEDGSAEDGGDAEIREVEFRGVSFRYDTGPTILENFNLTVRRGDTVALVGETGGGKSTIVQLLCRFYEPQHGSVLIDSIDYRSRGLHWLQSNLGIVQQSPHLFSGAIAENIRYGNLAATDGDVTEAASRAGADDFIKTLPEGYETNVGEGGNRLSTGQKQLVSLARAILADPRIFVLDEATSSVDTHTESLIEKGVQEVLGDRISFVIAHRLSTIRRADRILVIDDGRIVEDGEHGELLRAGSRYAQLVHRQFKW
jgi:ATP-binding cassette subfamily B protein